MYFFKLILKVFFDLILDTVYKYDGFFKTLLEKNFKFISSKRNCTFVFYLSFMLLLAKINLVLENWNRNKDAFMTCIISYVEIILTLLTEIIAFYIWVFLV